MILNRLRDFIHGKSPPPGDEPQCRQSSPLALQLGFARQLDRDGCMSFQLNTESASKAWDDLAQRLERFIGAWESGSEPALGEYLPAEPQTHRRFVLVELIKVDLEQRATRGKQQPLADYLADYPQLLEHKTGEPPCDLIYEEYHIRRGAGQDVSLSDYCRQYPNSAAALKRLIGTEGASVSTQLFSPRRKVKGVGPGQQLDDFELLAELGSGAFGSVYLARQVSLQRLVALKISTDKGHEPRTLAALDHPNIVRVFDQRRLPDRRMLLLYMVYAPGGTLADVISRVRDTAAAARSGAILVVAVSQAMQKAGQFASEEAAWRRRAAAASWSETVCRLGVPLAQALDHAHRQGVLHRDVKPANVLLSAEGSPKLADFNISFASQIEGATPAAYFGGSVAYMSPEQLEACNPQHPRKPESLDGRADLYSLAVLLWELLHGMRPFADEVGGDWSSSLEEMVRLRKNEPPYRVPGPRDPVMMRLEQVLGKALSSDPADRHPDGAALARELSLCLNPRAWDLLHDLQTGWRDWARRRPILALFPINLPPFVLASVYNLFYNRDEFIKAQPEVIKEAFQRMLIPVNATLFALGIAVVLWYAWPVARAVHRMAVGAARDEPLLHAARGRALRLGHWIAGVGLCLWLVAGIAFPVGIQLQAPGFPVQGYTHFLLSMVICGLISCCFPFLATTWLCVRVFFPTLLGTDPPHAAEQRQLLRLAQQSGIYLYVAVLLPLLAILIMIISGRDSRLWSILLIVASGIGYFAAQWTLNRIRADLAALSIATRPGDMIGTSTESVEAM
jgi:serine/threonine protein kinase